MGFIDEILGRTGLTEETSWQDRLSEAAYTSPSGVRVTFDYMDLTSTRTRKTTVFEFPDGDGALVQDHGEGARTLPMRIFISGRDYDKTAAILEEALMERGAGRLESPVYGNHTVIPVGDIVRNDALVSAANQAVFEVTFVKTIGVIWPSKVTDPESQILASLESLDVAGATQFSNSVGIGSAAERKALGDKVLDLLDKTERVLSIVARAQKSVNDEFQDRVDLINRSIDVLVKSPLQLARETKNAVRTPAKAMAGVQDRLKGYGNLAADIFSGPDSVSSPGGYGGKGPRFQPITGSGNDSQDSNGYHVKDLFAINYIAGLVESLLYTYSGGAAQEIRDLILDAQRQGVAAQNYLLSSQQAVKAALYLLEKLQELIAWRDENYKSLSGDGSADFISTPTNTDTGGAIQALSESAGLTAGYLIELSFDLATERVIVLDRARSIVDLAYELYGSVDDILDFFIETNNFPGDYYFEIPAGSRVVYYE